MEIDDDVIVINDRDVDGDGTEEDEEDEAEARVKEVLIVPDNVHNVSRPGRVLSCTSDEKITWLTKVAAGRAATKADMSRVLSCHESEDPRGRCLHQDHTVRYECMDRPSARGARC